MHISSVIIETPTLLRGVAHVGPHLCVQEEMNRRKVDRSVFVVATDADLVRPIFKARCVACRTNSIAALT